MGKKIIKNDKEVKSVKSVTDEKNGTEDFEIVKEKSLHQLSLFKNRLVNLEMKLHDIEKMGKYSDAYRFEFFKQNIEILFTAIDLTLSACELEIDRTLELYSMGWLSEDAAYYINKDAKEAGVKIKRTIKDIDELMFKAVN